MLEIFGIVVSNMLSLPGVFGMALGMLTRRMEIAVLLGGLVGVLETSIFTNLNLNLELVLSIAVGCIAGLIGCAFRRKGVIESTQNTQDLHH